MKAWIKSAFDIALIVLIVIAGKTAIAEPYYVPSGSMEPTLQIGDELLATKYPYGYSSASLPIFITLPNTQRILGALPQRGDIVVFRWPGNRSQIWVKRVVGLPGDRIAMKNGRLWINDAPVGLQADGMGFAEDETGAEQPVSRFTETLPGGRQHTIFKEQVFGMLDNMPEDHGATEPPVRHGRQPRRFRRQPGAGRRRRGRTVAGLRSGRTRRCAGRLVGHGRREKPAGVGLAV